MIVPGDYRAAAAIYGQPVPAALYPVVCDDVAAFFAPTEDAGTWEVHVHAAVRFRWRRAADAFRAILGWFWGKRLADRLVTVTRATNRGAGVMAVHCGFRRADTRSFPWPDGVVRQTVLYELRRPCDT